MRNDRTITYGYHGSSAGLISSVTGPAHTVTNTRESHRDVLDLKTNLIPGSPDVTVSAYDYTVNSIAQRSGVAFSGTAFSGAASSGCPARMEFREKHLKNTDSADRQM